MVICYGLGAGYYLDVIKERCPDALGYLVMEPDKSQLRLAKQTHPKLFQDSRVVVASDWAGFSAGFLKLANRWDGLVYICLPGAKLRYADQYPVFVEQLHRLIISMQTDVATSIRFARDWQRNLLANLEYLPEAYPVSRLFRGWAHKPCVIVSAGPSLSESLPALREAQDKCLVLAVGTVLPLLLREGIRPDFCLAFDGGWDNYWAHFRGVDAGDIPLIYDHILHHQILPAWKGPKIAMRIWPADAWVGWQAGVDPGLVRVGPSISNTALDLAIRMGADPIMLLGQDLAYNDGNTHAEGTNLVNQGDYKQHAKHTVFLKIDSWDGKQQLGTSRSMFIIRSSLEDRIAQHTGGTRIYNCSFGAGIKGAPHVPLEILLAGMHEAAGPHRVDMFRRLYQPVAWDVEKFANYLHVNWLFAENCLKLLKSGELDVGAAVTRPEIQLARFVLQLTWDKVKAKVPTQTLNAQLEDDLRFFLPLLDRLRKTWGKRRREQHQKIVVQSPKGNNGPGREVGRPGPAGGHTQPAGTL